MNADETANIIYLLILLLFVGSYFVYGQRDRLGQTALYAAIWGLVFVGVMIAYSFKDTLTGQLFPSAAIEQSDGAIVFRKANDGHFHASLTINDQPIEFLVDTGATNLVLNKRDARKVGINPDTLAYLGRAYTANGVTGSASVRLKKVEIGSIEDRDVAASVNEGNLDTSLLGMDYLSRFGEIVIKGETLTLRR